MAPSTVLRCQTKCSPCSIVAQESDERLDVSRRVAIRDIRAMAATSKTAANPPGASLELKGESRLAAGHNRRSLREG